MVVVDTSVWLGLFLEDSDRKNAAEELMKAIETTIYEPEVFKIELVGTLSRMFIKDDVLSFVDEITAKVRLIKNPNELTFQVAVNTGCRAIDAYFIATAKLMNIILIANDKVMVKSAKKYGIKVYYLIEEFDKVMNGVKDLQHS